MSTRAKAYFANFIGRCLMCDKPIRLRQPVVPRGAGYAHRLCAEGDR